jgi:hypothetical protein
MDKDNQIVEKAVTLSLIEVFLGSFLHAIKMPFTGHFLSLNQGLFLGRFNQGLLNRFECAKQCIEVSMVVAFMKALAPAGKKLGPMMSISMQGFLYALGTLFFGTQLLGQMLSMILLSLWAFCQPLVTYFLIYGSDLTKAFHYFLLKIQKYINVEEAQLYTALMFVVILKMILAACIPLFNKRTSWFRRYETLLTRFLYKPKKKKMTNPLKGAFQDLLRPAVLLSFIFMGAFFVFHGENEGIIIWKISRALAIAFILFYLARSPLFSKFILQLSFKNAFLRRLYALSSRASAQVRERLG